MFHGDRHVLYVMDTIARNFGDKPLVVRLVLPFYFAPSRETRKLKCIGIICRYRCCLGFMIGGNNITQEDEILVQFVFRVHVNIVDRRHSRGLKETTT